MAATIAKCIGHDNTRRKVEQRLGSVASEAQANTWHTFTTCYVWRDGSGYIEVKRGDRTIRVNFGAEDKPLPKGEFAPEGLFEEADV